MSNFLFCLVYVIKIQEKNERIHLKEKKVEKHA